MITFWHCNPWHAGLRGVIGEQKQGYHHRKLLTSRFGANIESESTRGTCKGQMDHITQQ